MSGQQRRRWPQHAETVRTDCIDAAQSAALQLRAAISRMDRARAALAYGHPAELEIADASREVAEAISQMEFVHRRLVEAKIGS